MRSLEAHDPVRVTPGQFEQVCGVLDGIDEKGIRPRISGHIGLFLRQYARGRRELDRIIQVSGVQPRADGAMSGNPLGAVDVHSLMETRVDVLDLPLGEVADTLCVSEALGGIVRLVLWLKGPNANAMYNRLNDGHPSLQLSGDYRWTPPTRLTPGEADLDLADRRIGWEEARCMKAVADDIGRPPHALEYVREYRLGPPGLKYFRTVCVRRSGKEWQVLPALSEAVTLKIERGPPDHANDDGGGEFAKLLVYREPWSGWTIVDQTSIDANAVLSHSVAWIDFQRGLQDSAVTPELVRAARGALRAAEVRVEELSSLSLTQGLLPSARDVVRHLRGLR